MPASTPITALVYLLLISYYTVRASAAVIASAVLAQHALQTPYFLIPRAIGGSSPAADRTVYTAFSLLCTFILGLAFGRSDFLSVPISPIQGRFPLPTAKTNANPQGSRIQSLFTTPRKPLSFIHILLLLLYFLSLAFVFSAALLESGLDLHDHTACSAAVYVCLVFYFASKGLIQLFLAERAHAVRARHPSRRKDPVWITCMGVIAVGFGTIMVFAFVYPVAEIGGDGVCRIGLPIRVTVPMLVYDVLVNAGLTGVFVWLLHPLRRRRSKSSKMLVRKKTDRNGLGQVLQIPMKTLHGVKGRLGSVSSMPSSESIDGGDMSSLRAIPTRKQWSWIDKLIWKSMICSVLVLLPTIANLGLLQHVRGKEQGWICLTFCTIDGKTVLLNVWK